MEQRPSISLTSRAVQKTGSTSRSYDALGRRTAVTDPNANRTSFAYDAAGRQTGTTDPLLRRTTFAYDRSGQVTLRVDARGLRTSYAYDQAGRPAARLYADGTRVTLGYDAAGQELVMTDSTGRTSTTYDPAGRVRTATNPAGMRVTTLYDAAGRRAAMIEPESGRFSYSYDAAGRLTRLTNPQFEVTTWAYDPVGRVTLNRMANGTRASSTYDAAGRLLRVANLTPTGTTLSSFDYAYDPAGHRTRVVEDGTVRVTYSYDRTYQLVNERRSGSHSYNSTYTYDPAGNRLAGRSGGVPTTYTYDAANQTVRALAAGGPTTYTYDAAGNLALSSTPTAGRTSYAWDGENRLTQAAAAGGTVSTFTYDGRGRRVQCLRNGGVTQFLMDGENVLLETGNLSFAEIGTVGQGASSFSDATAQPGTTYFYRVRAQNASGGSPYSNVASGTPLPASTSAEFGAIDSSTQGDWVGAYGADGYAITDDATSLPSYLPSLGTSSGTAYTFADPTTDARALRLSTAPATRAASALYTGSAMTFDVDLTDGRPHQVALYALDWDTTMRAQRVDVTDAASGAVLDSKTLSGFHGGVWVWWTVQGHVKFVVTNTGASNAVVSGLFFGGVPSPATVTFGAIDSSTQGDWVGAYGADGYAITDDATRYPLYATVSASGGTAYAFADPTTDVRALRLSTAPSTRAASALYAGSAMTFDVDLADGQPHQVALYAVDWDTTTRAQRVDVTDAASGAVLDTRNVTGFHGGVWVWWTVQGHVKFVVTNTGASNAVVSGLFFDASGPPAAPTGLAATAALGEVDLNWVNNAADALGARVERSTAGATTVQAVYTSEPRVYGNVVSQRRGGATSTYHFDGLGSTDALTDGTGAVADGYVYDAFGNILASTGSVENAFRYVGRPGYWYEPDLGLYLLRARWYDPKMGRFVSRDPSDFKGGDANLYRYVGNNPTTVTDPNGKDTWGDWLIENVLGPVTSAFGLQGLISAPDDPIVAYTSPLPGPPPLLFNNPRIPRQEFLAMDYYNKFIKPKSNSKSVYTIFSQGCVGLTKLRLGLNETQVILNDKSVKVFEDQQSLKKFLDKNRMHMNNPGVFAIQTHDMRVPRSLNASTGELDPLFVASFARMTDHYNFAAWNPGSDGNSYWEWMTREIITGRNSYAVISGTLNPDFEKTYYGVLPNRNPTNLLSPSLFPSDPFWPPYPP